MWRPEWRLSWLLGSRDKQPGMSKKLATVNVCLWRIQEPVRRWNRHGGRSGYLEFVSRYVG